MALAAQKGPSHTQLLDSRSGVTTVLNLMFVVMHWKFLSHSLVSLSKKLVAHFLLYWIIPISVFLTVFPSISCSWASSLVRVTISFIFTTVWLSTLWLTYPAFYYWAFVWGPTENAGLVRASPSARVWEVRTASAFLDGAGWFPEWLYSIVYNGTLHLNFFKFSFPVYCIYFFYCKKVYIP